MFSASCHYGLQAMFYIALHSAQDKNVELSEIAETQNIPKHFLSKILQLLVKNKLLISMRGPNGGFRLSRSPEKICLLQIVEAIDGLDIFKQCGIGFRECDDKNPCPIHEEYKKSRETVFNLFKNKTLEGLAGEIEKGVNIVKLGNTAKPNV
ncbi:MAG: Rrf2 family transcriptional regulator [Balneolaceae bacterium]|nr:MAG: Rrf2 family transcriptional regulator [Balneolaceae bacterium]